MKKQFLLLCGALSFFALTWHLTSCKPSEKNYKAAYELAQQREREGLNEDIFAKMQSEDGPRLVMYGTDSVYMYPKESLLISWQPGSANNVVTTAPDYNLVIGEYRNPANAKAHAMQFMPEVKNKKKQNKGETTIADSIPEGWDWYPMVLVQGAQDQYYVAIAHGKSVEDLLPTLRKFKQSKRRTVGTKTPVVRSRR